MNRDARLAQYRQIPPEILQRMPNADLNYIKAEVEKDGERHLSNLRVAKFKASQKQRWSSEVEQFLKFVVIAGGALTFSLAPYLLATKLGRSPIALTLGFVGGAIASHAAHTNAARALVGIKLKQSTEQARKAILLNQQEDV